LEKRNATKYKFGWCLKTCDLFFIIMVCYPWHFVTNWQYVKPISLHDHVICWRVLCQVLIFIQSIFTIKTRESCQVRDKCVVMYSHMSCCNISESNSPVQFSLLNFIIELVFSAIFIIEIKKLIMYKRRRANQI
jgi:hypothetical protein